MAVRDHLSAELEANYMTFSLLGCLGFSLAVMYLLMRRDPRLAAPWATAIIFLGILAAKPVFNLLIYFPVPTTFTFGVKIGGLLPATCAESLAVEGERGLPCTLKRLLEWVSGKGGRQWEDVEWAWIEVGGTYAGFVVFGTIPWVVFAVFLNVQEMRERARVRAEGESIGEKEKLVRQGHE